ncbi:MAG TPA: prolyl oligopeptidase family serine peptidase [Candidatus Didemnitutus sp.]|jgi:dipeptidyl aminopeptidase/acylaminoacyl peptidase
MISHLRRLNRLITRLAAPPGSLLPRRLSIAVVVVVVVVLLGPRAMAGPDPISIANIRELPDFSQLKISPDGSKLSAVVGKDDKRMLVLIDREKKALVPLCGVGNALVEYWWKGEDRILLMVSQYYPFQSLSVLDLKTKKVSPVNSVVGGGVTLENMLPDDPDSVLITLSSGIGLSSDRSYVRKLNLRTSDLTFVDRDSLDSTLWITNESGKVVAGLRENKDRLEMVAHASPESPWVHQDLGPWHHHSLSFGSVHPDQKRLMFWDYSAEGSVQIVALDPSSLAREIIFSMPGIDPDEIEYWGNHSRRPRAIRYETDKIHRFFFDDETRRIQMAVDAALPNTVNDIVDIDRAEQRLAIFAWSDRDRGAYYILDRQQKKMELLGSKYANSSPEQFAPTRSFSLSSRDGLTIHGRFTQPLRPVPGKPAPLVLICADSIAASRATYGFAVVAQTFATRGYAVARVDRRGSYGHGRAFLKAGDWQISKGMVNDLEDSVQWLAHQGWIDGSRVAIMGWGEGGIVALQAVANSKCFSVWLDVIPPEEIEDIDFTAFAPFASDRDEAIQEIGGEEAARQYRTSLALRTVASRISAASFHAYYKPDRAGVDFTAERLKKTHGPHVEVQVPRVYTEDEGRIFDNKVYQQMVDFLQNHLPVQ